MAGFRGTHAQLAAQLQDGGLEPAQVDVLVVQDGPRPLQEALQVLQLVGRRVARGQLQHGLLAADHVLHVGRRAALLAGRRLRLALLADQHGPVAEDVLAAERGQDVVRGVFAALAVAVKVPEGESAAQCLTSVGSTLTYDTTLHSF